MKKLIISGLAIWLFCLSVSAQQTNLQSAVTKLDKAKTG
jgi:hypothetical protein